MNGTINNRDIYERLVKLETRLDNMNITLNKLMNNDLSHLNKKIDSNSDKIDGIERKLAYAAGALAALQIVVPTALHYLFG